MAYKNLGTFLTKVTLKAIAKLDEADVDECMRIAENVVAWANAGTITSEQLDMLLAALPVDVSLEEPDASEGAAGASEAAPVTYDFTGMTATEVWRSLSYRPTKDELQQACDWLKLEYAEGATNAELTALLQAAYEAERASE